MRWRIFSFTLPLLLTLSVIACGPSEADIEAIVEAQPVLIPGLLRLDQLQGKTDSDGN